MDSQLTDAQENYFNLVQGQLYVFAVAGADVPFKVQFQPPGTTAWMDYADLTFTPPGGGFDNSANVVSSGFHAFASRHRVLFESKPAARYWYSVAVVTMPEF